MKDTFTSLLPVMEFLFQKWRQLRSNCRDHNHIFFSRIWCTKLVLSAGLYFFKKHDGCHIWRRIFLPIWNTFDPVFNWVCVAQSFIFCYVHKVLLSVSFFYSFVFGMVFSIYFLLVTLNIPFVSFASLCLPVLCHKNRSYRYF